MKKLTWMTVVAISFPLYLNPETNAKSFKNQKFIRALLSLYTEAAINGKNFSPCLISYCA
jgi:hypothetical protein